MAQGLLARSLETQFTQTALTELVGMVIGDWVPEEDRTSIAGYGQAKIDDLRQMVLTLGDEEDEQELYNSLAIYWLELKSEWTRYNQIMNYRMFRTGSADPVLVARGGICSGLIARFEVFLTPGDLALLTEVSAQPLEVGRPDLDQLRRYLQRYVQARAVVGKAVERAEAVGGDTSDLKNEARELGALELNEVWSAIAGLVQQRTSTERPYAIEGRWSGHSAIEPEHVELLATALAEKIDELFASTVLATPEARVEAGLPAYVPFSVSVTGAEPELRIALSWPEASEPIEVAVPTAV